MQQSWFAYFNQARLNNQWGIWFDAHLRTKENFMSGFSSGIARVGVTYYITDRTKLTAGYAYIHHFPTDSHADIARPEHRPWQQLQWHNNFPRVRVMQYARLEQRYRHKIKDNDELAEGYNFNYRVRYNLFFSVPLNKQAFAPNTLSLILNDEMHVNFGREVVFNYFDQNRFFAGLGYHINAHDQLQFGYMNVFQQLPAGNKYRNTHVLRLFYVQNLDLRN